MKIVLQELSLVVPKRRKTRKRYYENSTQWYQVEEKQEKGITRIKASGTKKKKNMKKVLQELSLVVLSRRKI